MTGLRVCVIIQVVRARINFRHGQERFSLRHRVQTGSAAHPVYPKGIITLYSVINRPQRETDHSTTCSAEGKYICLIPYIFTVGSLC